MDEKKLEQNEAVESAQAEPIQTEPEKAEEPKEDFREKACEKLKEEQKKADNKQFAEPVIDYLLKRCEEDRGLAEDVMQEHKTWDKCYKYIYDQARKQIKGSSGAVRDDVVFEWAEDYFHLDDKAEEERKAKEAAERKKKEAEAKAKAKEKAKKKAANKTEPKDPGANDKPETPKVEKPKPKKNEVEGQMDFFSMMGL